jgi:hypothetical protein
MEAQVENEMASCLILFLVASSSIPCQFFLPSLFPLAFAHFARLRHRHMEIGEKGKDKDMEWIMDGWIGWDG